MTQPIDLYIISGFLGAGKTTFLKSMMNSFDAARLGVLVNEFGSIGVDGKLIDNTGIRLVEINNGSIFCACIRDGFVRTLKDFSQQPIDTLLIESSGMADPAGVNTLLENLSPYLDRPYCYRGCVCLVDCTTFLDYIDVLVPLQGQIASADLILANKTDLADAETLAEVHGQIRLLNKEAPVYNTQFANIPKRVIDEQLTNRGFSGVTSNNSCNRPSTYALKSDAIFDKHELTCFFRALSERALRVKGFVRGKSGWLHVDGVAGQLTVSGMDFTSCAPPENGQLVLITTGGGDVSSEINAAYYQFCPGTMELEPA